MTDTVTLLKDQTPHSANEWWRRAVIYQVYPRSFADSNGDGEGDIGGIIDHLDHLVALGVDAVWLSPIYPSPRDDNGYDISDYQQVDPAFGDLAEFDRLVSELHARGIKLVMDLVVNHTSDEHAWFAASRAAKSDPKRDWYWWRPPRPGFQPGNPGAEPTNWESFFGGSVWEFDPNSGEYYLHLFSRKQPDLNWENPEVRGAVYSMMNWWLDRGVDGFRMDVINLISKDPGLPDGAVADEATLGDGFPHYSYGPRIHEFLHEMHDRVFGGRPGDFVTVGEMPGVTVDQARLFTDPTRDELDMVFQFDHVGLDHGPRGKFDPGTLDLVALKRSLADWQEGLATTGWNSLYWNNHDQPRAVSRFGDDGRYRVESAKALAAVLHLQRGTPYIFQGEELGMTNVPFAGIDEIRDIESLNHFAEATAAGRSVEDILPAIRKVGRDNARTPMQWSDEPRAGFSHAEPWIAANPNSATINASAQVGTPGSVFEFYRELIALRHREPVVAEGDFHMLVIDHPRLFAYTRSWAGTSLLVVANFSSDETDAEAIVHSYREGQMVLGNYDGATVDGILRPWEVRVVSVIE